ncbi:MAG: ketopantoate reductase family protein, partial [Lachnospiraceae bacterium]|nr:ketopantoate reductase family protein [Lachnospiraceae bacterium]
GLKPDGYPSMRQDAIAHRATEVELFAGTIMKIAAKHGIEVPANTAYYQKIKEIEAKYS